jgi:hypothetical protein
MPTPTYTLIDSVTLTSSASSVTFSAIAAGGDLVLVIDGTLAGSTRLRLTFNSDSGANYSSVRMDGNGTSATSWSGSGLNYAIAGAMTTTASNVITQIQDFSATDKHKSILTRSNAVGYSLEAYASRWASTSAVTSLTMTTTQDFQAGSTFRLLGVN